MLRDVFQYKPVLTKQQFLQCGFSQSKIAVICDIINLVLQRHKQLKKEKVRACVLCVIEEEAYFVIDILMFVGKEGSPCWSSMDQRMIGCQHHHLNTPDIFWYTMQLIMLHKSNCCDRIFVVW